MANAGVIAALARPGDVVFSDEGNHASLIDGCRLSRAEVFVYDHGDVEHLAWGLAQAQGRGALIVTESVFSIDGDWPRSRTSSSSPSSTGCACWSTRPTASARSDREGTARSPRSGSRTRST